MGFNFKSHSLPSFFLLFALPAFAYGWGIDGHQMICQIAQDRLSESAAAAVKELLPAYAGGDLSALCSWADRIKFRYRWSSELHYIDTPDDLCTYNYNRDCKDEEGVRGRCVSGAITNYTNQLLTYRSSADEPQYNLTEALLFLSHFMGDIHQPLHVGFTSDRGGNTIDIRWFRRKSELHSVWDKEIIETAEDRFYENVVEEFVDALKRNITGEWSDQVVKWEKCSNNDVTCPDIYASESIKAACNWAYKDVKNNTILEDDYFLSRLPIVNLRLAESAVRLAATLNRIFE
ncbi:endonuclease 2-like [Curcuma longa]|uniref:endonuclease 2-like n=1 Tax=Curcuma longa TaxID=136217 RepID=UPI003D9E686D